MIALCRRIPQTDQYVRQGRWAREGHHPFTGELTGATVGILGLGRIGKEFARRAQAFKMRVVYHGRSEQPYQPYVYYADLEAMGARRLTGWSASRRAGRRRRASSRAG